MKAKLSAYKNLYILGSILTATLALSQITPTVPTGSENYIFVIEPENGNPVADAQSPGSHTIQYFDGLGRPKQTIMSKQTTTGVDMMIHYEYDGFGRQVKDYLPVRAGQSSGAYVSDPIGKYNDFYNGQYDTEIYYSQKEIENSPLNRVIKQAAPGDDWELGSGKEIKFEYLSNTTADGVKKYTAGTNWSSGGPSLSGTYAPNLLYKTVTTDENGNHIQEFKNKSGQVILKRTFVTSATTALRGTPPAVQVRADTYYVYDIYGNLTYVIPPLASAKASLTAAIRNDLCYQYKYDARNRLIEKKLPGKEWEYMVYDRQDRLVATQDANLRTGGNWIFTKYDKFGRVVYTGIYNGGTSRTALQTSANAAPNNNNETRQASIGFTKNTLPVYYSTTAFPSAFTELLSVNYYDSYANVEFSKQSQLPLPAGLRSGVTANADDAVKGLSLVSHVRVLATNTWEKTLTYYDIKSRPVVMLKANHQGGYTETLSVLNFRGQPTRLDMFHKRSSQSGELEMKTVERFTYDTQGRLTKHTHKIGNKAEELIALNGYDQLGQLSSKKVGGTDLTGTNRLQDVNYKYNIRGWLTDINNVNEDLTSGRGVPGATDDLFAFHINYNTLDYTEGVVSNIPAAELYNGNISQTFWRSSSDNKLRGYSYEYDELNRLRHASYTKVSLNTSFFPGAYDEAIAYDVNGNILNLIRYTGNANENPIDMDNLTYTYQSGIQNSNRLMKVTDSMNSQLGFSNGSSGTADDYTYDNNGNMLSDLNKGITEITYNHLNLPTNIYFGNGNAIEYFYNAAGQKLKKSVYDTSNNTVKHVDYLDGFQYAGGILNFFPTAEGYVSVTESNSLNNPLLFNYVYNYTDHLGNIRFSYTKDPVSGALTKMEENHYYPFGLKHGVYSGISMNYQLVDNLPGTEPEARPTYVYKTDYQYKYNGKEFQDELGLNMYAMDMRQYDPAIARWVVQDPVEHLNLSPYNAFDNNPVFWADPSGADSRSLIKDLWDSTPEGSSSTWVNADKEEGDGKDDWYKGYNKEGELVVQWFDDTSKGFVIDGTQWINVGENLDEAMDFFEISKSKQFTNKDYRWHVQGGSDRGGRRGQVPVRTQPGLMLVSLSNSPDVKTDSQGNLYFTDISTNIHVTYYVNKGISPGKNSKFWASVQSGGAVLGSPKALNLIENRDKIFRSIEGFSPVGFQGINFKNSILNLTPSGQDNPHRFVNFTIKAGYTNANKASTTSIKITP